MLNLNIIMPSKDKPREMCLKPGYHFEMVVIYPNSIFDMLFLLLKIDMGYCPAYISSVKEFWTVEDFKKSYLHEHLTEHPDKFMDIQIVMEHR